MKKRIYLDYAATTPMDPKVVSAMEPYFSSVYGNPNSIHSFGQEAVEALDASRRVVAGAIGAEFEEIIFTGSATEANNLCVRGLLEERKGRVVVSSIEHESLQSAVERFDAVHIPVDENGVIDVDTLREKLDKEVTLVSVMYGNNEIGTIQPIEKIAEIVREFREKNNSEYPLFHTDAVQAFQYLPCDVRELGVDLLTFSAHKIYGPKGVGVLYIRDLKKRKFRPLISGRGQEFGMRGGTENVPGIVGCAKAVELVCERKESERGQVGELRKYFISLLKKVEGVKINGLEDGDVLPHILNTSFPRLSGEDILIRLDMHGVAVSSGAACVARAGKPSHVLKAIGLSEKESGRSIRFSLGRGSTKEDINEVFQILQNIFR